jgi:UDP-N-acetyl-D-mannosaminuronic acid dehydrogenase
LPKPGQQRDVVVVGCGAIGLPLAVALASKGVHVLGVDSDSARAAALGAGRTELLDAGLAGALHESLASGRLAFAQTVGAADHARAYVIATPTPALAGGGFDKAPLEQALADIAFAAQPGDVVCVRSTVPIGATRGLATAFATSGLAFAACPDRSIAGNAYAEQLSVPHVVGGLDEAAGAGAEALFARLGRVVRTPDPETAEAIKLFANVQRDVTFALANQFALVCEATGVDFAAVRQAGAAGFARFSVARPGPVGGPCLTKDLALLLASRGVAPVDTMLLRAARDLNEGLVEHFADAIEAELVGRPAAAVAILGLAFKGSPPTADRRGAFAGALTERLRRRRPLIDLRHWDPVRDPRTARRASVEDAAVVVLANDHPDLALALDADLAPGAVVFDVTGQVDPGAAFDVRRLGDGTR